MVIGLLTVSIHIPESRSLKSKRMVLRSLKDRIHSNFNVALAELDGHDQWQMTQLGVVTVGQDKRKVNEILSTVLNLIERARGVQVVDHEIELG